MNSKYKKCVIINIYRKCNNISQRINCCQYKKKTESSLIIDYKKYINEFK